MTYKAVLNEPYAFKDVRKLVDSCAFTMYGHWVKRSPDQLQNRNTLFANDIKCEIKTQDTADGTPQVPSMYSHDLTHAFLPKRTALGSLFRKGSVHNITSSL